MMLSKNTIDKKKKSIPTVFYIGKKIDQIEDVEGPYIHFFYIYQELIKKANVNAFSRKLRDNISNLISSDFIWIEYPFGRYPIILTLLLSCIWKKKIALIVRDLPVMQAKSLKTANKSTLFYMELELIEKMIVKKSNVLALFSQGFSEFMDTEGKTTFIFTPGVRKELLHKKDNNFTGNNEKKVLLYAGSLDRGGMISKISSLFSDIEGWELWIAGEGNEAIDLNKNTKYIGVLPYNEVEKLYDVADAVAIPYPFGGYFDVCTPLKTAEVLASCKPIISSSNKYILQYIQEIKLGQNVVFVDNWNIDSIQESLNAAENIIISREETIMKLENITWDKKAENIVTNVLNVLNND